MFFYIVKSEQNYKLEDAGYKQSHKQLQQP